MGIASIFNGARATLALVALLLRQLVMILVDPLVAGNLTVNGALMHFYLSAIIFLLIPFWSDTSMKYLCSEVS